VSENQKPCFVNDKRLASSRNSERLLEREIRKRTKIWSFKNKLEVEVIMDTHMIVINVVSLIAKIRV
jgi:site-specific recombinase XerC